MKAVSRGRWWRLPAIRALMIQCGSFCVALAFFLLAWKTGFEPPLAVFLIFQGAIAALMSSRLRLAPWWLYIHFFFPVALGAAQSLHLPAGFFLGGFVVLAALFWSTFYTQVPFYPSRRAVWAAVAELLPESRPIAVMDLGSGLGGLVCHLARVRPDARITGIESAPLPWLLSWLRRDGRRANCRFIRGDYKAVNFADYDVLFAYLSSAAMPALWEKARLEMRPGTLLLSYEFAIPGLAAPIRVMPETDGPILYGWHM